VKKMELLTASAYQGRAQEIADAEVVSIGRALPGMRIEHIGSSAIPGALSKGDIDLCVLVPAVQFEQALAGLERLGYREKFDTLRTDDLCMLVSPRQDIDLAVQLVVQGSEFEFFLTFRDALRASTQLVERYNQVKQQTAHLGEDEYRAAKSSFIEMVLAAGTA
jgi:GrpB-like predicted nucleotidyltransferase (UPF0157 family)